MAQYQHLVLHPVDAVSPSFYDLKRTIPLLLYQLPFRNLQTIFFAQQKQGKHGYSLKRKWTAASDVAEQGAYRKLFYIQYRPPKAKSCYMTSLTAANVYWTKYTTFKDRTTGTPQNIQPLHSPSPSSALWNDSSSSDILKNIQNHMTSFN